MEQWRKDARSVPVITDLEALVPRGHLLREIEKIMDYEWLYERLDPYYCHDNGRPGTDPVVLIKMVLIQHLYGIPSLRQTYQRIQDSNSFSLVSGVWSAGPDSPFCHGELCLLQAFSGGTGHGNL